LVVNVAFLEVLFRAAGGGQLSPRYSLNLQALAKPWATAAINSNSDEQANVAE
jgi:hypothetical protein